MNIADLRKSYERDELDDNASAADPLQQFDVRVDFFAAVRFHFAGILRATPWRGKNFPNKILRAHRLAPPPFF